MSDPDRSGPFVCHGDMTRINLLRFGDNTSAFLCLECGCWRHGFPPGDPRRAKVEAQMPAIIEAHLVGSRGSVE